MKKQKVHSGSIFAFHEIINGELVRKLVSLYDIIINNDFEKLQYIIEKENINLLSLLIFCVNYKNEYFTNYLLLLLKDDKILDERYFLFAEEQIQYLEKVKNKYNSLLKL
jgi:hypothetical protein